MFNLFSSALCLGCFGLVFSLRCLDDSKNQTLMPYVTDDFDYCVMQETPLTHKYGRYGIRKAEDSLDGIDALFAQQDDLYGIKTVCIMEEYRLPAVYPEEILFRCYCAYDNCNGGGTMKKFLKKLVLN